VLVGAIQDRGKWVPEQHWPTVKYLSRNATNKKNDVAAGRTVLDDAVILAQ
jgi:hypothetical protein